MSIQSNYSDGFFNVSANHGFLPVKAPLVKLPSVYDDLQAVLDKKIVPTKEQLALLDTNQISPSNPVFAGFEIHNLFEFFMVFVILCGIAAAILFALTPRLKKMMHGIN